MPKTYALVRSLSALAIAALVAACSGVGSPVGELTPLGAAPDLRPSTQESVIYTFLGGTDGGSPYAGLLARATGDFYGTTWTGGSGPSGGYGTVFKMSSSGTESVLYSFQGGADAANPQAGLTAGKKGVLYGSTVYGGGAALCAGGCGAVFELTPSGSGYKERVLYAFQGGNDGAAPVAGILSESGALYGTTVEGGGATTCTAGVGGCGVVFKLTPSGSGYTQTVLYSFKGGSDGAGPRGTLMADNAGALYGTTYYGGRGTCSDPSGFSGCGTAFKLTPSGTGYTESVLHSFQGGTKDGAYPRSALVAGKSGALYGATMRGGIGGGGGSGTVFKLMPKGAGYRERVLYFFQGSPDGAVPVDENGLYSDSNGTLYGTTIAGGKASCGCGTVFRLAVSGSGYVEAILHSFKGGSDGADPRGRLAADSAGTLYGTTFGGAKRACSSGCGVVYKVSP